MSALGQVLFDPKEHQWVITRQPHVSLRLKRVFNKIAKSSQGRHRLSDTAENARELEWFLNRFPLEINADVSLYLATRANEFKEAEAAIQDLLSGYLQPRPFDLAIPPRDYQKVGAEVVLQTGGTLVADDLGTGKTVIAICTLTEAHTLPALVVTLTHLTRQWEREINRFAPQLRTHIIKSGKPYDVTRVGRNRKQLSLATAYPDVLILNYHKLAGWAETLTGKVKSLIFDETQELRRAETRNQRSAKYRAAKQLADHTAIRSGYSATPIYNFGGEFYNVLDVVRPGALGTRDEFVREWCVESYEDHKTRVKNPKAFGAYLRSAGLMIRRTRAEVGRELPPLTKIPHHIGADLNKLSELSRSCEELARLILREGEEKRGEKMLASEEFSNVLRQATGIAKAPFVAEFVKLLVESGERVALFGWHRTVYDIWRDRLHDIKPVMYTGSESVPQKEASVKAFVSGDSPVLIISLRAGAGLDGLQGVCRTAVVGELDWSPGVHEQNIGRLWRDGQKEPVVAYFLIADSGADPTIADVLGLKKQQLDGVIDPDRTLVEKLQIDPNHVKKLAAGYLEQLQERGQEAAD